MQFGFVDAICFKNDTDPGCSGWGPHEVTTPVPLPPNATRWQVLVNNVPVFLRGQNWIPRDQSTGRGVRETSKTRALIRAAAAAGMNWLRIWGGGLIEDEAFYQACDEWGVMLLQEMPHAGCAPGGPGDLNPDFTKLLPVDFAQQVINRSLTPIFLYKS
jgi:beta-galactosidase/beta-glucuronidase